MNYKNTPYFPLFDWLRFFLALTVLLGHMGIFKNENIAAFAVEIFFALSGWLIGSILLRTSPSQLNRFYFNRAIRIWIPYFFTLCFVIIASILHKDSLTGIWYQIVFFKLTMVYNWFGTPLLTTHLNDFPLQGTGNHFWSVNVEEQFYLLAPLILVLIKIPKAKNLVMWAIFGLIAYVLQLKGVSIIFGVIASILASEYGDFYKSKLAKLLMVILIILSMIGLQSGINYLILAPWCAIAVVLSLTIEGRQNALGKFAGGISYELYMNAWIGGFIANLIFKITNLQNIYYRHFITLTLAIVVAALLYWLIDKRFLDMRNALYDERKGLYVKSFAYISLLIGLIVGASIY